MKSREDILTDLGILVKECEFWKKKYKNLEEEMQVKNYDEKVRYNFLYENKCRVDLVKLIIKLERELVKTNSKLELWKGTAP